MTVCSNRQIDDEDFVNFCGLLRKHELYKHCGTSATGRMQGSHPTSIGETVTRTFCFQHTSSTCQWSTVIKVRNCGQFFLYRLVNTPYGNTGSGVFKRGVQN